MHYLVDGYSVIHSWPHLKKAMNKRLAYARDLLLQQLQQYQDQSDDRITLFFDGRSGQASAGKKAGPSKISPNHPLIKVVFSEKGQSADMLIEQVVGHSCSPFQFSVVTADHAIENTVSALGASSISPDAFLEMIKASQKEFSEWLEDHQIKIKRRFQRD